MKVQRNVHAERLVEQPGEINTFVCNKGYNGSSFHVFIQHKGGTPGIAKRNYRQNINKDTMD
ncbi:hypothetical protein NFHSH190041_17090 [Shewanella sp. NFH-SH190041]|nr:hypothetical protein NFHSH190041_17090 [Shewanella sp. NFH-SH190041]